MHELSRAILVFHACRAPLLSFQYMVHWAATGSGTYEGAITLVEATYYTALSRQHCNIL